MNTTHETQTLTAPARATSVVAADRDQLNGHPGTFKPDVIAIKNLRIEYRSREMGGQTKLAVKDLSLSVHAGEGLPRTFSPCSCRVSRSVIFFWWRRCHAADHSGKGAAAPQHAGEPDVGGAMARRSRSIQRPGPGFSLDATAPIPA